MKTTKTEKLKIKPVERLLGLGWREISSCSLIARFGALLCSLWAFVGIVSILVCCGQVKYIPVKGETIVRDSIVVETRIDTVEVQLPPVTVKDYSALEDTLHLDGVYERAWAAVDAERELLIGGIETTGTPVKTNVVYKDRLVYRDSVRIQEVPVPVEVIKEKRVVPWFWKTFGIIGLLSVIGIALRVVWKVYGSRFLKK